MIRGEIRKNRKDSPSAEMQEREVSAAARESSPYRTSPAPEDLPGAYLVGVQDADTEISAAKEYIDELEELVRTLGIGIKGRCIVPVREVSVKYYIGSGKMTEIRDEAKKSGANMLVIDCPLGPSQQRNIEKLCSMKVYDRQEVILDIFASRAATREAVIQVELARNQYYLPRLTGAWSHLSRQHGGAMGTRGEGEKQIEYDRRMVKRRISALTEELEVVRKQRLTQRKARVRGSVPNCAIIGYTNAGKSSLLNALTGADVLAEDKLFATLDPTTRRLELPDKSEVLLTDTVGFVRKLPHSLIEAFKSTLEEAVLADFLLLVLDASSPYVESHWETSLAVLAELKAQDKPVIVVFNKCDLQKDPVFLARLRNVAPDGLFISVRTREGFPALLNAISSHVRGKASVLELDVPPERSDLISLLHAKCAIRHSLWDQTNGHFCAGVTVPSELVSKFQPYISVPPAHSGKRKAAAKP